MSEFDQPSFTLPAEPELQDYLHPAPQQPLYNLSFANSPEREGMRAAFADKANNGGIMPDVVAQSKSDENPQDFRDLGMNMKALSFFTGTPADEIPSDYELHKQNFVKAQGWDMPKSEGQFRDMLAKQFEQEDARANAFDAARGKAITDSLEDASTGSKMPLLARYAEWNTEHAGAFIGVDEHNKMRAFLNAYAPEKAAASSDLAPLAADIVKTFQNDAPETDTANRAKELGGEAVQFANKTLEQLGVSGGTGFSPEVTTAKDAAPPEQQSALIDRMAQVPAERQGELRALVQKFAKASAKGDTKSLKNWAYKIGQTAGRATESAAFGIGRNITMSSLTSELNRVKQNADNLPQEEQQKKIDSLNKELTRLRMGSMLRTIAQEDVNPIENPSGFMGTVFGGIPQGIASGVPYLAAFGVGAGVGAAFTVTSILADVQSRIIAKNPEASHEDVEKLATYIGVPVAALNLVGFQTVAGALPSLEAALHTLPLDRPILNAAIHGGISSLAITAAQEVEHIGTAIAHAIRSDFNKDERFADEMIQTLLEFPSTFLTMTAMGAMGHGMISEADRSQIISQIKDRASLRMVGINPDVMAGKTDAEVPAVYREAWKSRDEEAGKEFRAKVEALAKNAQNDPSIPKRTFDVASGDHVITAFDPINGNIHELLRTKNAEAADKAFDAVNEIWRTDLLLSFLTERQAREADAKAGITGRKYEYSLLFQSGESNEKSPYAHLSEDIKNRILTAELPEGSDIVQSLVAGWNSQESIGNDILKDITSLIHTADVNPRTFMHERMEDWTKRALMTGSVTLDQFKDWVTQAEKAVSDRTGKPVTFLNNKVDPDIYDIVESVTKAGEHLFSGHIADYSSYPENLRGYYMALGSYYRDVSELGQHFKDAVSAGEIPKDFSEHLATALGLPAQDRLEPKSAKVLADAANPHLAEAGLPTFSIKGKSEPEKESVKNPDPSTESGSDAPSTPLEDLDPSKQTGEEWKKIPWSPDTTYSVKYLPTAYPEMSKEIYDKIVKDTDHVYGMWIDRMRVGDYKGIPLQGGMFYPTIKENLKKGIVWAYNAAHVTTTELGKAAKTGGYMKLLLMQEGNVIGNKTFAHCWFHDLQENIDAGKLTAKQALAELNRIRDLYSKTTGHEKAWKSLKDAKKDIVDMPQQKRGSTYFQKTKTTTKAEGEKISYQSLLSQKMTKSGFPDAVQMVNDIEEPSFKGLPIGAISGIIQIDPNQESGVTAKEAGVPEHMSYGYVLKGRPIARMTSYKNVKDLFPEIPDYPMNWSTTPLDVERGLASTFSLKDAQAKLDEMKSKLPDYKIKIDKTEIKNGNFYAFGIYDSKGNQAGSATGYYEPKTNSFVIEDLGLKDEYKGQKFGEALYREIIKQAQNLGAEKITGAPTSADAVRVRKKLLQTEVGKYFPEEMSGFPGGSYEWSESKVPQKITFSLRSAEDRQKFFDELDKRIHSDPEVYTPIWEKMREKVAQVQKNLDQIAKMDARDTDKDFATSYREQGLVEINAVINSLPKEIRSEFTRNWRSPYSGEQGNIFSKYSSLTSDKERTDFLIKVTRKAKDALDDSLIHEYSDKHQKLLDAAQPKMEAGKRPEGKLGADVHSLLNEIQKYSHMDLAELSVLGQSLEAQKNRIENGDYPDEDRDAMLDKLDQQIWLADLHGGMSITDAEGKMKTAELRRRDLDRMAAAVDELKQIIKDGRFDFNATKQARMDEIKQMRQEVINLTNGGKAGTPSSRQAAKDKEGNLMAGMMKAINNAQLPVPYLRNILRNSPLANEWARRIYDAQNKEADSNIKFRKEAINFVRNAWGENGKPVSVTKALAIIADLSKTVDTGIKIRPNNVYKAKTINKEELPNYRGLVTDREYNYLLRVLADQSNSKIKRIVIHELVDASDEEELKLSPLQLVDALMAADQPDAREKVERNGLTPEVVDKIREFVGKSKAQAVYDFARQAYDNYDRINEVFRKLYGVDLPRVENYSPLTFDTSNPDKIIDMDEGQGGGAGSQPSALKSRGNFGGILRYDNAWSKLQNHMSVMNYWIANAEMLRDFRAVFGDPKVLRAVESGNAAHREFLQNFMRVLSRDAMTTQNIQNWNNWAQKTLSSFLSVATLGGSIPTAIKHITVATAPLLEMPIGQFLGSALRVSANAGERPVWFGDNSMFRDPVVHRFAEQTHSETGRDAIQAAKDWKGIFSTASIYGQEAGKFSMEGIHKTVNVSAAWAAAVRYDGAFREATKAGMTPEQAKAYATEKVDDMLHETMNPTFPVDRPISRWGKVGPDWMQMYAGPAAQRFAKVIDLIKSAKDKDAVADHAVRIAVGGFIAAGLVEWLVKAAYTYIAGSDKQKEEVLDWHDLVAAIASGPFYGMPLVGPFLSTGIKSAITGHNPLYSSGNPISDMTRSVKSVITHWKNDDMGGKEYAEAFKDAALIAGSVVALIFHNESLGKAIAGIGAYGNTGKAVAGAVKNAED
jgi:Acetyltransferase (GNAT) family